MSLKYIKISTANGNDSFGVINIEELLNPTTSSPQYGFSNEYGGIVVLRNGNYYGSGTEELLSSEDNRNLYNNLIKKALNGDFTTSDVGKQFDIPYNGNKIKFRICAINQEVLTENPSKYANIKLDPVDTLPGVYNINDSNTNAGGYRNSKFHNSTAKTIEENFGWIIKYYIQTVNITRDNGSSSYALETFSARVYLPSVTNLNGDSDYSSNKDGSGKVDDLYKTNKSLRVRNKIIWTSSSNTNNSNNFVNLNTNGSFNNNNASNENSVDTDLLFL